MKLPSALPGFESINRYWNKESIVAAKLLPGEYYITAQDEQLVTTTGSTIAVHLEDPKREVGALVHFALLPNQQGSLPSKRSLDYGAMAMDLAIHGLVRLDAVRGRMRASIYGGARIWSFGAGGPTTVQFAANHLAQQGIATEAVEVDGLLPRKIWLRQGTKPIVETLQRFTGTLPQREWRYFTDLHGDIETTHEHASPTDEELSETLVHLQNACQSYPGETMDVAWRVSMKKKVERLIGFLRHHFAREENAFAKFTKLLEFPRIRRGWNRTVERHPILIARLENLKSLCGTLGESHGTIAARCLQIIREIRAQERSKNGLLRSAHAAVTTSTVE